MILKSPRTWECDTAIVLLTVPWHIVINVLNSKCSQDQTILIIFLFSLTLNVTQYVTLYIFWKQSIPNWRGIVLYIYNEHMHKNLVFEEMMINDYCWIQLLEDAELQLFIFYDIKLDCIKYSVMNLTQCISLTTEDVTCEEYLDFISVKGNVNKLVFLICIT